MGNEKISEKLDLLKMEYPKNLLYAVRGALEDEEPTELTQDVLAGIQYAVSTLNEREQYILIERYKCKRTLRSIGEDLGVKSERVRQLEAKAERRLRHPRCMTFMTKGVVGFIKRTNKLEYERGYQCGYDAGYKQGMEDAPNGIVKPGMSVTLSSLPIEVLDLSVRAFNALKVAGYDVVGDITALAYQEMIHIKNLGPKQRHEVAAGLRRYGITNTDWDLFYHKSNEDN